MINWIFISIILYLPSLIVFLFWKEKNKYKFIYSGTYVAIACITIIAVLHNNATTINKMKTINSAEKRNIIQANKNIKVSVQEIDDTPILEKHDYNVEEYRKNEINQEKENEHINQSIYSIEENYEKELIRQQELIEQFKEELYEIEKRALIPLRNSYDILKKMKTGQANIKELYKEAADAKQQCEVVEKLYSSLVVPKDIDLENRKLLYDAKSDLQKAYYLRGKAMENGLQFLDSKNPKYIMKCKEELKSADKLIYSCVQKLNKVKSEKDE